MSFTPATIKALEVLRDNPGIAPREFAQKMWPDSPGWSTHTNAGRGVTRGGGMNLAGGAFLGRLRKLGLSTWRSDGHYLTSRGAAALKTRVSSKQ